MNERINEKINENNELIKLVDDRTTLIIDVCEKLNNIEYVELKSDINKRTINAFVKNTNEKVRAIIDKAIANLNKILGDE